MRIRQHTDFGLAIRERDDAREMAHSLSTAIRVVDSWHTINLRGRCDCPGHVRVADLRAALVRKEPPDS